ncbi:MAG: radical SAM protein [Candidatus Thermoplasmatota archaeon]|nr:radical SAM protein [Candidatus Thermoplasmatota archaeon]
MKKFPVSLAKPFMKRPFLMGKLLRGSKRKYFNAKLDKMKGTGESSALWLISMRITDKCNHRCKVCGQYGEGGYNREDTDLPAVKGNVPVERYKEMIDNIEHLKPHIYITGGEPFLYDGLMEFGNYVKEKGLSLQVVTNGVKLEEKAEEIVENEWDMICVSVDGPEEVHDECRGVEGAFKTMKEGVEKIQRLKEEKGKEKPMIFTLTTLSSTNYDHLLDTVEVAQGFDPDTLVIYYSWFTSQEVGEKHSEIIKEEMGVEPFAWKSYVRDHSGADFDALKDAVEEVKTRDWDNPVVFVPNIKQEEIETYYKDPTDFLGWDNCLTPWVEANIMPNGDVVNCRDFPDIVMGNMMQDDLLDIYNNEKFKKFRKALAKQPDGVFPICSRCCGLMGF